jgi:hypothetical protein
MKQPNPVLVRLFFMEKFSIRMLVYLLVILIGQVYSRGERLLFEE